MGIFTRFCSHSTRETTFCICGGTFAQTSENIHTLRVKETLGELGQAMSHYTYFRLTVYTANNCSKNKYKTYKVNISMSMFFNTCITNLYEFSYCKASSSIQKSWSLTVLYDCITDENSGFIYLLPVRKYMNTQDNLEENEKKMIWKLKVRVRHTKITYANCVVSSSISIYSTPSTNFLFQKLWLMEVGTFKSRGQ